LHIAHCLGKKDIQTVINFKVGHHGLFHFGILTSEMYLFISDICYDFLDWGSARRKASSYTGQHKTQKRLERDSKPRSQFSRGWRQYVP